MIARTVAVLAAGMVFAASSAWAQTDPSTPLGAGHVTFTKDIAPILQRSCQSCHRPDSLAPMSLLTYEEARPYAAAIKRRTASAPSAGPMPPWYIEKDIGIQRYKNDISLSDEEVAEDRAVGGQRRAARESADMPPPLKFADNDAWRSARPTWSSDAAVSMKADQPGLVGRARAAPTPGYGRSLRRGGRNQGGQRLQDKPGRRNRRRALHLPPRADGRARARRTPRRRRCGRCTKSDATPTCSIPSRQTAAGRLARRFPERAHARERQGHDGHLEIAFKFHPKGYKPKIVDAPHADRHRRHRHPRRSRPEGRGVHDTDAADEGHRLRAAHACRGVRMCFDAI